MPTEDSARIFGAGVSNHKVDQYGPVYRAHVALWPYYASIVMLPNQWVPRLWSSNGLALHPLLSPTVVYGFCSTTVIFFCHRPSPFSGFSHFSSLFASYKFPVFLSFVSFMPLSSFLSFRAMSSIFTFFLVMFLSQKCFGLDILTSPVSCGGVLLDGFQNIATICEPSSILEHSRSSREKGE